MVRGTWDLSTLTTDQTRVTCIAKLILCNGPPRKKSPVFQHSPSTVDPPATLFYDGVLTDPSHPLFLPDLHSVPLGFHSPRGKSKGTQDTYITMSGLDCSGELQTGAHPPILTADAYHIALSRPCSNSSGRGAAFIDLTF